MTQAGHRVCMAAIEDDYLISLLDHFVARHSRWAVLQEIPLDQLQQHQQGNLNINVIGR
jgi:hypothetical protein